MKSSAFLSIIFLSLLLVNIYLFIPASAQTTSGATSGEIGQCKVKSCFINILMVYRSEILKQQKNKDGTFFEIYKVQRNNDVELDEYTSMIVSSGKKGLWNVVNYPLNGYMSDNTNIIFKTTYNIEEVATKIELQLPD